MAGRRQSRPTRGVPATHRVAGPAGPWSPSASYPHQTRRPPAGVPLLPPCSPVRKGHLIGTPSLHGGLSAIYLQHLAGSAGTLSSYQAHGQPGELAIRSRHLDPYPSCVEYGEQGGVVAQCLPKSEVQRRLLAVGERSASGRRARRAWAVAAPALPHCEPVRRTVSSPPWRRGLRQIELLARRTIHWRAPSMSITDTLIIKSALDYGNTAQPRQRAERGLSEPAKRVPGLTLWSER